MREIIKTLIEEGIEREDILVIASFLMEEYEEVDEGNNLEDTVARVDKLQGNKMSLDKYMELKDKASKVAGGTNDYYIDKDGKEQFSYTGPSRYPKGHIKNIIKQNKVARDPKRKERKESIGRAISPNSMDPESIGNEVFKRARVQRKLQKKSK